MSDIAVESTRRCSSVDVGELDRDLLDDGAPEPARGQHVRLVDARQQLAAAARQLEGETRHARDLGLRVEERVVRLAAGGPVVGLAALPEVEAAGELADDEHVHALDEVAAAAATRRERRARRRPGRRLAKRPSALRSARSPCSGRTVADGSSHFGPPTAPSRIASAARADVEVLVADGRAVRVDGDAADEHLGPVDREAEALARGVEDALGRRDDLGPDAVAAGWRRRR